MWPHRKSAGHDISRPHGNTCALLLSPPTRTRSSRTAALRIAPTDGTAGVEATEAEVLEGMAKAGLSVFVRAASAQAATSDVLAWAAEQGRTVIDVSPFYTTDLRGEPFVSGSPPVSDRALSPWLLQTVDGSGPKMLLLPDVVEASSWMSHTNVSVLRTLLKDRRLPNGTRPADCFVVATAAQGEGALPGLSGDAVAHIRLA